MNGFMLCIMYLILIFACVPYTPYPMLDYFFCMTALILSLFALYEKDNPANPMLEAVLLGLIYAVATWCSIHIHRAGGRELLVRNHGDLGLMILNMTGSPLYEKLSVLKTLSGENHTVFLQENLPYFKQVWQKYFYWCASPMYHVLCKIVKWFVVEWYLQPFIEYPDALPPLVK